MKISCNCNICLHNREGNCLRDEVSINISGMCTEYVATDIPQKLLQKHKEKMSKRFTEIEELINSSLRKG